MGLVVVGLVVVGLVVVGLVVVGLVVVGLVVVGFEYKSRSGVVTSVRVGTKKMKAYASERSGDGRDKRTLKNKRKKTPPIKTIQ